MLSIHLIVAFFNLSNTIGWGSAQACCPQKKFFINTQISRLSCRIGMGMGGNWDLLDGAKWEWDVSFKWEWDGNEVLEMGGIWYE